MLFLFGFSRWFSKVFFLCFFAPFGLSGGCSSFSAQSV